VNINTVHTTALVALFSPMFFITSTKEPPETKLQNAPAKWLNFIPQPPRWGFLALDPAEKRKEQQPGQIFAGCGQEL
jgi:hypothetical protein